MKRHWKSHCLKFISDQWDAVQSQFWASSMRFVNLKINHFKACDWSIWKEIKISFQINQSNAWSSNSDQWNSAYSQCHWGLCCAYACCPIWRGQGQQLWMSQRQFCIETSTASHLWWRKENILYVLQLFCMIKGGFVTADTFDLDSKIVEI